MEVGPLPMHNLTENERTAEAAELRRKVAILERQLGSYQRFVQQMADLSPGVAGVRGPFFRAVVETVAHHLNADYVIVAELVADNQAIHSLATYAAGEFGPEQRHPLTGTSAEQAVASRQRTCSANARQEFPQDARLNDWGIQTYIGVPLTDIAGEPIGVLEAFWEGTPEDPEMANSTVLNFAGRASRELERVRAEEALRESESRFRTLCEACPLGIFECDERGFADYISARWFELNHRPPQEHLGFGWVQMTHPDDIPGMLAAWKKSIANRAPLVHEYRSKRTENDVRWLRVTANPIHAEGTGPLKFVGCVEDVTDRKQAERSLHESELRFRSFMDNNPAIAFMKDAEGRKVYVNNNYVERFGVPREQLLGRTDFDMFDAEIAERLREADRAVIAAGKPIQFEEDVPTPDGVLRHWLVYKFPFVDALKNQFLGGVAIDITERRQMEEALREARDELEERVAERTADLTKTNDRLRQEVLDRRKVEAALLTEQVSLQQMLLAHDTDRKLIAYEIHDGPVQYVTAALMHLESAMSAHGGSQGTLAKAMATPLRLLRETIQEARRMINGLQPMILGESGVAPAIQYLIEANPGSLKVDFQHQVETERYTPLLEGALFRIAQEALNNARKYSQAKQVWIRLKEERGWVRLEVIDDGVGFNPKSVPKRTVGLNGIRERARLLHGHAIIDSAAGRGTRISVEIPVNEP